MKTLKILGIPVASFGESKAAAVPRTQERFLGPRYEPSNISQNATVQAVQNAIRLAENGDTQELFRFYRDVLLGDDHIQSCFNTRKLALLAQPLSILPKDKNNPADVALAQALIQARDDCENWEAGLLALMDSDGFWPVSVVERLYKPAGEIPAGLPRYQYTLRKFVPVNPQLLCFQWAYLTGGVGLGTASAMQLGGADVRTGLEDPYKIDLERFEPYLKLWPVDDHGRIIYNTAGAQYLDPARHIVHRGHLLQTFRDNWGGPGRAILMWWLFRQLGREWFARGMERYGSPFPVGYTDASDPAAVALLRDAFDLAKKVGGLVVDESSRVELKEALVQGMAQGYETFYNLCNQAISYHITGIHSSQQPAGLNAGQSNFASGVREDVRMFDQIQLGATCVRQIAMPFRDINGLKGQVKYVWGGLSDADAKTFADLLKTMSESGFEPEDDSLPIINERTGIAWKRKTPPPALALPGAPGQLAEDDEEGEDGDFPADKKPGVKEKSDEEGEPKTLAARLVWLSSGPGANRSPVDDVVKAHSEALARAFKGSFAPVRQIILNSTSREDAEQKLKVFFADYDPARISGIVEQAMQVCAAKGAVKATEQSR
jgi:phage gp29-like protein